MKFKTLILTGGVLLVACGSTSPSTHDLTGTVDVYQNLLSSYHVGGICNGYGPAASAVPELGIPGQAGPDLSDLKEGADVVVKDQGSTILATGRLGTGTQLGSFPSALGYFCEFTFKISGVADKPFYQVAVGQQSSVTFSRDDVARASWHLDLPINKGH